MFTPVISSSIETALLPLQSPTQSATVAVAVGFMAMVTVGVALVVGAGVLVGDDAAVRVAVALVVVAGVAEWVPDAVRVGVNGALGVGVTDAEPVAVRVASDVGFAVRVAVDVPVAGGVAVGEPVGVGLNNETGAENGEVLLLLSVLVAVTLGPTGEPA